MANYPWNSGSAFAIPRGKTNLFDFDAFAVPIHQGNPFEQGGVSPAMEQASPSWMQATRKKIGWEDLMNPGGMAARQILEEFPLGRTPSMPGTPRSGFRANNPILDPDKQAQIDASLAKSRAETDARNAVLDSLQDKPIADVERTLFASKLFNNNEIKDWVSIENRKRIAQQNAQNMKFGPGGSQPASGVPVSPQEASRNRTDQFAPWQPAMVAAPMNAAPAFVSPWANGVGGKERVGPGQTVAGTFRNLPSEVQGNILGNIQDRRDRDAERQLFIQARAMGIPNTFAAPWVQVQQAVKGNPEALANRDTNMAAMYPQLATMFAAQATNNLELQKDASKNWTTIYLANHEILNNPNSTPEQKAAAQKEITNMLRMRSGVVGNSAPEAAAPPTSPFAPSNPAAPVIGTDNARPEVPFKKTEGNDPAITGLLPTDTGQTIPQTDLTIAGYDRSKKPIYQDRDGNLWTDDTTTKAGRQLKKTKKDSYKSPGISPGEHLTQPFEFKDYAPWAQKYHPLALLHNVFGLGK